MKIEMKYRCSEDWEAMPLSGDGRFCQSCEKEIIDFSHWSDAKIAAALKGGKSLCGRIHNSRLNRTLQIEKPSSNPIWALSILSALASAPALFAQETNSLSPREQLRAQGFKAVELAEFAEDVISDSLQFRVKGQVIDSDNQEYVALANILIYSNETLLASTHTDVDGSFRLSFKASDSLSTALLKVQFVGYKEASLVVDLKAQQDSLLIPLNPDIISLEPIKLEWATTGIIVPLEEPDYTAEEIQRNWFGRLRYQTRAWFIRQRYRLFP